jgi:hypothetical protein
MRCLLAVSSKIKFERSGATVIVWRNATVKNQAQTKECKEFFILLKLF